MFAHCGMRTRVTNKERKEIAALLRQLRAKDRTAFNAFVEKLRRQVELNSTKS